MNRIREYFVATTIIALGAMSAPCIAAPPAPPDPPSDAWIAFNAGGIWLSNGSENGRLMDGHDPAWSPGGDEIACWGTDPATGSPAILRASVDGSSPPLLVCPAPHPAYFQGYGVDWSGFSTPSGGDLIAFVGSDGGPRDLYVVRPDGSDLVQLTDDSGYFYPRWSPDGTRIVVAGAGVEGLLSTVVLDLGLVAGQLAVTNRTVLTGVPGSPIQNVTPSGGAFSPDGNWIVTTAPTPGVVYRINADDPLDYLLVYHDPGTIFYDPIFNVDGTEVMFSTYYSRKADLLATVDAWGGSSEPTFLTPGFKGNQRVPDLKPSGAPPAAPSGLVAAGGDGFVSLDWDDNAEPDLDGYYVYRATTSGGTYALVNGTLLVDSDYVDTTVTNGTTYYYVVTAVDTTGNESADSAEAAATPQAGTGPTHTHVEFILCTTVNAGGGNKRGQAQIMILDDLGGPVADAIVTAIFTGDYDETVDAVTGTDGVAVLTTIATARGGVSFTACVDGVVHATLSYDAGANVVTCGSN